MAPTGPGLLLIDDTDWALRDRMLVDEVVADAGNGEIHEFRRALHARRLRYVMSIRGDISLKCEGRETGPAQSVEKIAARAAGRVLKVDYLAERNDGADARAVRRRAG